ncbi:unnamed protein product [Brassica napus]|uniref:(rape) hypothetical protein n=1 Tax=Brassica napus TaxID=3708 RepID=A0A816P6H6_BRANA|nr:unnamed protein product [Brassica napus]
MFLRFGNFLFSIIPHPSIFFSLADADHKSCSYLFYPYVFSLADTENHSDPNQEEDPSLDNNSQMLVLQTPPKPFNMHTREVDDSDDFVGQVPQCVSSRPTYDTSDGVYEDDDFVEPVPMCVSGGQTHETSDGEDEDDDFVEPVPQCVSGGQTHETLVGEDEDDDFIGPVPQSRSREEDARRSRETDKADDESLMKYVRVVELYGFEDVESSSNNEAVNDYTMKEIVEDDVYSSFDLYKHPWWTGLRNTLLRRCYDVGNPSTLYIKGVEYFYALQRHEEGLALMKRAADAGYERALYTYAMTRKLYWDDEEYFASFTREAVGTIGWLVRMDDVPWVPVVNEWFLTKKFMFMSTDRPLFYNCPCSPTLDFDWDMWHMELSKTEDMCNRCF